MNKITQNFNLTPLEASSPSSSGSLDSPHPLELSNAKTCCCEKKTAKLALSIFLAIGIGVTLAFLCNLAIGISVGLGIVALICIIAPKCQATAKKTQLAVSNMENVENAASPKITSPKTTSPLQQVVSPTLEDPTPPLPSMPHSPILESIPLPPSLLPLPPLKSRTTPNSPTLESIPPLSDRSRALPSFTSQSTSLHSIIIPALSISLPLPISPTPSPPSPISGTPSPLFSPPIYPGKRYGSGSATHSAPSSPKQVKTHYPASYSESHTPRSNASSEHTPSSFEESEKPENYAQMSLEAFEKYINALYKEVTEQLGSLSNDDDSIHNINDMLGSIYAIPLALAKEKTSDEITEKRNLTDSMLKTLYKEMSPENFAIYVENIYKDVEDQFSGDESINGICNGTLASVCDIQRTFQYEETNDAMNRKIKVIKDFFRKTYKTMDSKNKNESLRERFLLDFDISIPMNTIQK